MRRELPSRPHLDHLKKQAKELLAAHKRGEDEAMERLRAALPSLARKPAAEIAGAKIALHDAQSAIAREYGFASWNELRAEVARRSGKPFPEALVRALMGQPLPGAVTEALRDAWAQRRAAAGAIAGDPPSELPLVALRNAFLLPGSLAPIHLGRASSLAAVDAAMKRTPPTFAMFSQRSAETEDVTAEALYPIGVEVLVHTRVPAGEGRAFLVLEALRWISLVSLADADGYQIARVAAAHVDDEAEADAVPALAAELRDRARGLAKGLPEADRAVAMIDELEEPEQLGDLVVANLPASVEDKARYAAEPTVAGRLRIAIQLADAALKVASAAR
jgi:Lon protease-like protein